MPNIPWYLYVENLVNFCNKNIEFTFLNVLDEIVDSYKISIMLYIHCIVERVFKAKFVINAKLNFNDLVFF